ncbi:MAG: hypothetical protein CBD82_04325 [Gammaproteobacteria bacterium TMED222]|nr:MAG: hypothetical protein CBD82_04325 [Gammaproteobacteria bacterium TMED222]
MPIRTLPSRAIADASIQAVDIANSSISKTKIDADTRLGLQNDSIILDGTDGAGANKGDFLSLNGTDGSSTNADDRILFDETFIDKVNLFNINTLGSSGQALKVNDAGNDFTFGSAGTNVKITETNVTGSVSEVVFNSSIMTGYNRFKIVVHNLTHSTTADLRFADSPDNGSTVSFTSYYGSHYSQLGSSSHAVGSDTDTNYYDFAGWNFKANVGNYLEFDLTNFGSSGTNDYKKYICNWIHYNNNNNHYGVINYFSSSLTSAMNYIKFYPSSGTIDEGKFIVYGVNE